MKGTGPSFNGGGGGDGKYSGGGGGSQIGIGGFGGKEDPSPCTPLAPVPRDGGTPGVMAERTPDLLNRLFMGGGGGASTRALTGTTGPGGYGGGIVIIVTDTIIGNGGNIISNGSDGSGSTGAAGSAGGGAGGTIALSTNSFGTDSIRFKVAGGNGGSSAGSGGEGGGGGGGLLWISKNIPSKVKTFLKGGIVGSPGDPVFNPSGPGALRTNFKAVLNGFLFNSISSSVTGNQVDSICSTAIPPKITGTKPVGGTAPYTYLWEKSYNQVTWLPLTNDADPTNFTPSGTEPSTVWFRRTITDSSIPTAHNDISKAVQIIVQPAITGNLVGKDTTICFNQDPLNLIPLNAGPANGSSHNYYLYKWVYSNLPSPVWSSAPVAPGNSTLSSYDPPALTASTYYERVVTSGRCVSYSPTVSITVLNVIKNDTIFSKDQSICYGTLFTDLTASTGATTPALTGGDNIYRYKWESNINSGGWVTAPGANTGPGYNPLELSQRVPYNQYIFRRIVYSGLHDVCSATSNNITLKDFPVITGNTITPVSPICSGFQPSVLTGSKSPVLTGGDGIYTYVWQDSSKTNPVWTIITGATSADYQPPVLTEATRYRRIVNSPASSCSDISKSIGITVHAPILNNTVSLVSGGVVQTICNSQVPSPMQGPAVTGGTGIYNYQWKYSNDNITYNSVPAGGTLVNFGPIDPLTSDTYYKREVKSGACTVLSNDLKIIVLPLISNNVISGNSKVCFTRIPDPITGQTLSGGSGAFTYLWQQSIDGGSNWYSATGTNSNAAYQAPALSYPTSYRRIVTSGLNDCCVSISNTFDIGIDPLPASPLNAGSDTLIFSVEKLYHMKALPPLSGEKGIWKVLFNGTGSIIDSTSYKTIVSNLSVGKNSFLWTLSRGICKLTDTVTVELVKDFFPQGFSPNGDAWNNTFVIEGLNPEDNYLDLSIVNGAGTEVFSTTNRNNQKFEDWDGKNAKGLDLSEGTYYYMLKITPKSSIGSVYKKSGFIILKRY
jgi:hypothetical protein